MWRRAAQKNKKRGYEWRRKGITRKKVRRDERACDNEAANNSCLKASADMLYEGLHLFPTRCFLSFSFVARSTLKGRGKKKKEKDRNYFIVKKKYFRDKSCTD